MRYFFPISEHSEAVSPVAALHGQSVLLREANVMEEMKVSWLGRRRGAAVSDIESWPNDETGVDS